MLVYGKEVIPKIGLYHWNVKYGLLSLALSNISLWSHFPLGDFTFYVPDICCTLLFIIAAFTRPICLKHSFIFWPFPRGSSLQNLSFFFPLIPRKRGMPKSKLTLGLIFENQFYLFQLQSYFNLNKWYWNTLP